MRILFFRIVFLINATIDSRMKFARCREKNGCDHAAGQRQRGEWKIVGTGQFSSGCSRGREEAASRGRRLVTLGRDISH